MSPMLKFAGTHFLVLAIFAFVFSLLRRSGAVKAAVRLAEQNAEVALMIGRPVKIGWLVFGSVSIDAGGGGYLRAGMVR